MVQSGIIQDKPNLTSNCIHIGQMFFRAMLKETAFRTEVIGIILNENRRSADRAKRPRIKNERIVYTLKRKPRMTEQSHFIFLRAHN